MGVVAQDTRNDRNLIKYQSATTCIRNKSRNVNKSMYQVKQPEITFKDFALKDC